MCFLHKHAHRSSKSSYQAASALDPLLATHSSPRGSDGRSLLRQAAVRSTGATRGWRGSAQEIIRHAGRAAAGIIAEARETRSDGRSGLAEALIARVHPELDRKIEAPDAAPVSIRRRRRAAAGTCGAGLDARVLEGASAVSLALREREAAARWALGETLFGGAVSRDASCRETGPADRLAARRARRKK